MIYCGVCGRPATSHEACEVSCSHRFHICGPCAIRIAETLKRKGNDS